jgi:hypothetical protein
MPPPACALIAQFERLAEMLDAAGLGPADYLYSSLKWRLQQPGINRYPLTRPLLKLLWQWLTNPPMVPREIRHAAILAASSYVVSANLLRQVVAVLEAGEGILLDASDERSKSTCETFLTPRTLLALPEPLSSPRVRGHLAGGADR